LLILWFAMMAHYMPDNRLACKCHLYYLLNQ
jgi:hypothetical protein